MDLLKIHLLTNLKVSKGLARACLAHWLELVGFCCRNCFSQLLLVVERCCSFLLGATAGEKKREEAGTLAALLVVVAAAAVYCWSSLL